MTASTANDMKRFTGLLIIEVVNSNPNGDPDRESDPRQRPDGRGEISPVSFKRKIRDLIEAKDGAVWQAMKTEMDLSDDQFEILESRGRVRKQIENELKDGSFQGKYWDGRVFGNTFLEGGAADTIKTGVAQFRSWTERGPDRNQSPHQHEQGRGGRRQRPWYGTDGISLCATWSLLHAVLCESLHGSQIGLQAARYQLVVQGHPIRLCTHTVSRPTACRSASRLGD